MSNHYKVQPRADVASISGTDDDGAYVLDDAILVTVAVTRAEAEEIVQEYDTNNPESMSNERLELGDVVFTKVLEVMASEQT